MITAHLPAGSLGGQSSDLAQPPNPQSWSPSMDSLRRIMQSASMKRFFRLVPFAMALWLIGSALRAEERSNLPAVPPSAVPIPDEARTPLVAFFGGPLPISLQLDRERSRFEYSRDGRLKHLSLTAKVSRADFKIHFKHGAWKEVTISNEDRLAMHFPRGTPKDYVTCYLGSIDHRSVKCFWSDYAETLFLMMID